MGVSKGKLMRNIDKSLPAEKLCRIIENRCKLEEGTIKLSSLYFAAENLSVTKYVYYKDEEVHSYSPQSSNLFDDSNEIELMEKFCNELMEKINE